MRCTEKRYEKKNQIVTNDIYKLKKALFTDASRALC